MDNPKYQNHDQQFINSRLKTQKMVIAIGLSASISAVMFGYSIKQISCVPIQVIVTNYNFTMENNLLLGILIAILPFGGLFGSLLAKIFIKTVTRIKGMHYAMLLLIFSLIIVNITMPIYLLAGRFMEGISIGYYVSIAPVYLKQISPKELRSLTGTFFSLGKIIGIIFAVGLQLLIGEDGWRILLSMTGVMAAIQSILLGFIGIDTAYQWAVRENEDKVLESLNKIYVQQAVEVVKQQIYDQKQINSLKSQYTDGSFEGKKKNAFFVAINVCVIRHFSGGNSLITSAGIIMAYYSQQIAKWTPLLMNVMQLFALFCYIFIFSKTIGKRALLVSSTYMLAFINLTLVLSLIIKQKYLILGSIIIFMFVYGGILLSAVWSYPSDILAPDQSLLPNMMNWIALSISTLAPELVMSIMPNNEVYPCFIFFFIYTLLTAIYFQRNIVQSNDRSYQQIINEFKEW